MANPLKLSILKQLFFIFITYEFCGSGILEGFGYMVLSQSLSSGSCQIGTGAGHCGVSGTGEEGCRAAEVAGCLSLVL